MPDATQTDPDGARGAVVDGAAVTALSEGRDVHATAADLLSKIAAFGTQPDQEHERDR